MNRTLLKRVVTCILACIALMAALAGCSKESAIYKQESKAMSDAAEKVSLTFFGFKADALNLTAIENAMQSFMAVNPHIDITYEGIKGTDYWDAFDKRDKNDVLDDVFMMHHDHVISMVEEGKLADLSDLKGLDRFTDEAKGQFVNPDGSVYFIPTTVTTYNLYINYDMLNAHDQEIPSNWEDFQQVCDYFVSQGITPIIANNRNSLGTLILSKGLYDVYQQPDDDIAATLEAFDEDPMLFAEALEPGVLQVKEMIDRGWFDLEQTLATEQTSDDLDLFVENRNPFMITGGWATGRVGAKNPGFEYGVFPYPILDDGSVLSMQMDTCISVNAKSENLDEAKRFVEHLIAPDNMWAYCDSQASYTPLKGEGRLPSDKTLVPSTEYLDNGRVAFRAEYRLSLPMEAALKACTKALLEGGSAQEAQEAMLAALIKQ